MNKKTTLLTGFLLLLGALHHAQAATTTQKCGNYTIVKQESRKDWTSTTLTLKGKAGTVVTLTDMMGDVGWCKDVTGDKIPEVDLAMFSGGAHCCFTHTVYSLTNPPRKLLEVDTQHSDFLQPSQLDGKGPLELTTADWSFAYAFGMSFAESVALPEIYSYVGGQYVVNTLAFPAAIGKWFDPPSKLDHSFDVLSGVAKLLILGKENQVESFLKAADPSYRDWIHSYLPDIKRTLSTYGLTGYPQMAGIRPEDTTYFGAAGGFTRPGAKQLITFVRGSDQTPYARKGQLALLMVEKNGNGWNKVPLGLVVGSVPSRDNPWDGPVTLPFAVKRSSGLSDLVVADRRSGSLKLQAHRVLQNKLTLLQSDALAAGLQVVQDFSNLADVNARVLNRGTKRTPEQWASLMDRSAALRKVADRWAGMLEHFPENIGQFDWHSLQLLKDTPQQAQIYLTLDFGRIPEDASESGVYGKRHGLTIDLQNQEGWKVKSLTLTPLRNGPYEEEHE